MNGEWQMSRESGYVIVVLANMDPPAAGQIMDFIAQRLPLQYPSGEDIFNDGAGNVGETEVPPAVAIRQFSVIEATEMEDRGMQIVNVDGVFEGLAAELIRRSVHPPAFHAPAG